MGFSVLRKTRAATEAIFIAVFLLVIGMPFVTSFFAPDREKEPAMRGDVLNALRAGHFWAAADTFKSYYEKGFGLREKLVALNAAVKLHALGVSSSPAVAIGRNGYLFYLADGSDAYARGLWPLDDSQLESWRKSLEFKRNVLASRRTLYMFVMCPNKESVYPEYYPRAMNRVRPENNLNQLMRYMKEKSDFRILDLRPPLIEAKQRGQKVFYRTDTHWTLFGAYAGYRAMVKEMSIYYTDMHPLPLNAFGPLRRGRINGDLSKLMGLRGYMSEPDVQLASEWPAGVVVESRFKDRGDEVVVTHADGAPPVSAVIMHDSFMNGMMPFISRHFHKTYFVYSAQYRQDIIARVRPGVVIEEMVERLLQ